MGAKHSMRETDCTLKIRNKIKFYEMPKAIILIDNFKHKTQEDSAGSVNTEGR